MMEGHGEQAFQAIERLEIEDFGCIKKASFALTPLHALIGPNDSGKSTVLAALRTAVQFEFGAFQHSSDEGWSPFDPDLFLKRDRTCIRLRHADRWTYAIQTTRGEIYESVRDGEGGVEASDTGRAWNRSGIVQKLRPAGDLLEQRPTMATMVRFEPDDLRAATSLILESQGLDFTNERGEGLASVYDAILNRNLDAFIQIQTEVQRLFPSVGRIQLKNVSESTKEIAVALVDGAQISAK